MNIKSIYDELSLQIDKENLLLKAEMKDFTSFKTGGTCELLVIPQNPEELALVLKRLAREEIPHLIMGNGSNLLVRDGGYPGVIVKLGTAFSAIEAEGTQLHAGAGALLKDVAKAALAASLTGFEFASGIPGSMGGGAFMNAGAYDGELVQVIASAQVLSADGERQYSLPVEEMALSYRHSIFQETGDVILRVTLSLAKGDAAEIQAKMNDLNGRRREKQPLDYPSAGSFFKRPTGYYAGKLITDAGLKGLMLGGAQVSPLHAGFIINTGKATATDIVNLMEVVRNTVYDASGVMLEPEVRIIGDEKESI